MGVHLSVVMPVYNERHLVAEAVRRVLAVDHPNIDALDLIVVDDGSSDGTTEVLRGLAEQWPSRVTLVEYGENRGKGAAVVSGIEHAEGSVTVIQDADLEYNPRDLPRLMVPFLEEQADAVYGSRFAPSEYRRVLYYRHEIGNRLLTLISNLLTDLNLSDMETCYKAVRTSLLKSIPLRSNDFRIEPELTFKLAKREARMFEVPISFAGRTYQEGKKIGLKDAFLALGAMLHWWVVDDCFKDDEYGSNILMSLSGVRRFNRWMSDALRPYVGQRVLEIGAGIGNLSRTFLPRERFTASDISGIYLERLRGMAEGRPYFDVSRVDLAEAEDFEPLAGQYDTVICLNVLEHVEDEAGALANIRTALEPEGRAVILVPQNPKLFGTLDEVLEHCRRYTRGSLREALERAGFEVDEIFDFNRVSTPAWWWNGKVLRRRHFGRVQLKIFNSLVGLFRRIDRFLPFHGVSLVAVARKPVPVETHDEAADAAAPAAEVAV